MRPVSCVGGSSSAGLRSSSKVFGFAAGLRLAFLAGVREAALLLAVFRFAAFLFAVLDFAGFLFTAVRARFLVIFRFAPRLVFFGITPSPWVFENLFRLPAMIGGAIARRRRQAPPRERLWSLSRGND